MARSATNWCQNLEVEARMQRMERDGLEIDEEIRKQSRRCGSEVCWRSLILQMNVKCLGFITPDTYIR